MDEMTDRPDLRYVACVRCGMRVAVQTSGPSSLTLFYDVERWRSKCCCAHLSGPMFCCSFLDLERIVNALWRSRQKH
jgi:hypothetical protein